MNTASISLKKMCPIWAHECYGDSCQAWNCGGYCNIIAAKSIQPIDVSQFPIYKPSSTSDGSGRL